MSSVSVSEGPQFRPHIGIVRIEFSPVVEISASNKQNLLQENLFHHPVNLAKRKAQE